MGGLDSALGGDLIAIGFKIGLEEAGLILVDYMLRFHNGCGLATKIFGLLYLAVGCMWHAVWVCSWAGLLVWDCLVSNLWAVGPLPVDGNGVGGDRGWVVVS